MLALMAQEHEARQDIVQGGQGCKRVTPGPEWGTEERAVNPVDVGEPSQR